MALTYIPGATFTLGVFPSGVEETYENIDRIGEYEYPVYSGEVDTTGVVSAQNQFYHTGNAPYVVDNRVQFLSQFNNFNLYYYSSNAAGTWPDAQVFASHLQYISTITYPREGSSVYRESAHYTITFKNDDKYYTLINDSAVIRSISTNTTIATIPSNELFNFVNYYTSAGQTTDNFSVNFIFVLVANDTYTTNMIATSRYIFTSPSREEYWGRYIANLSQYANTYLRSSIEAAISGKSLANCTLQLNNYNWRYTGEFITPTLTVTDTATGTVLTEGTDYTKTYVNNLNAGTANVLAAGIGDYTGSKSIDFYIIATDLTILVNCTLNKYIWEYTGDFITPEVQVWDALEEVQLIENVDYQYTYTNNLNIGTADVTIVGIGNWTGTVHLTFTIVENDDPYSQGGTTDPSSGHDGDYDNSSDPVDFPVLPSISAISSRLVTVYVPTLAELQSLAGVLWGGLLDPASFIKLLADPWDYLLGLSMIPVTPSYAVGTVFMANVNMGITMRYATTQYVNLNCGIVHLSEYWGNYLDYSPYTKVEIYLPYIGMRSLDIDDIMGRDIQLRYTIDILTGTCVAMLKCIASDHITDFDDNLNSVVYTFTGNCATQIPLTANNWNETYRAIIQMTVSAANTIATGAMRTSVAKSPDNSFMERSVITAASNIVSSAASSVGSTNKPIVQKSNTTGSTAGFLSIQKPYLVITRPIQALPALQNTYTGYPQYATLQLSDLTGYTEVESIHLLGIPGTLEEVNEIYTLLHSGVIL